MVRIVEVSPRDGLQNEAQFVSTEQKLRLIQGLLEAGLREIEVTSFVSPKAVPQLADAAEVWSGLPDGGLYSALVPNRRGLENALACGVNRIALFTAADDEFTQRNINRTVDQSLSEFSDLVQEFRVAQPTGWIRMYLSNIFESPFAGLTPRGRVAELTDKLLAMGADEVSLGDTIGAGTPREVHELAQELATFPKERIAWHFHDTRGMGIANVIAAMDHGYRSFDTSSGGLGGCPFAPRAGGNLATEKLLYYLERSSGEKVADRAAVFSAVEPVLNALGKPAACAL